MRLIGKKSFKLKEKIVEGFAIFAHVPGNSLRERYRLWSEVVSQRGLQMDAKEAAFLALS